MCTVLSIFGGALVSAATQKGHQAAASWLLAMRCK
jgi:hypothetical protein